ncbi:MAG: hypothetical protein KDE19_22040, partial [Caldilineaceae bacterium]|nr:hypothetical protein [Caldilineaceae bacterium]
LMALADKLGGNVAQRIPWPNLANFIQTRLTSLQLLDGNLATDNPETFWTGWLQHGGWWSQETTWVAPQVDEAALAAPLVGTIPTFAGDEASYPFHLLPLPSSAFGDGRHAGLPWLQEMPDPMTTAAWDTWVEINPATAERLGIDNNELVLIESPAGAIRAIVYTFPGIHPETVAVPIGQGHTELGRWARNRGDNVLKILVPQMEANTGQLAWAATRVRISKTGEQRSLPLLESNVGVDRFRRREL